MTGTAMQSHEQLALKNALSVILTKGAWSSTFENLFSEGLWWILNCQT